MELVTLQRSKSAHKIHVNKLFQKAREILNSEDQDAKEKVKIKVSLPAKLEKILKVNEDILLALCLNSEVDKRRFFSIDIVSEIKFLTAKQEQCCRNQCVNRKTGTSSKA